jgi:hypothetical protein
MNIMSLNQTEKNFRGSLWLIVGRKWCWTNMKRNSNMNADKKRRNENTTKTWEIFSFCTGCWKTKTLKMCDWIRTICSRYKSTVRKLKLNPSLPAPNANLDRTKSFTTPNQSNSSLNVTLQILKLK